MRSLVVCLGALAAVASPLAAQRIKLPMALAELESRVRSDSNDAAAHYNVALGYWNEKRYDESERALKQAVALDGKFAPGYLALAYLPYARRPKLLGEELEDKVPEEWKPAVEESDRNYRRAFLIDPLVDVRILGAIDPPKKHVLWENDDYLAKVWDFYIRGYEEFNQGNYEDAYGRFVTYIREIDGDRFPKRVPESVLWFQGLAAAHTQKYDAAIRNFKTLIDRLEAAEKKQEEDKDLVRVPLRINEYRFFMAHFNQAAGRQEDALGLYRQTLEQDIGLYMAHVQIANILESQKRFPEAIEARRSAVNANPDDPSLLLDLGITLGKSGKFDEAEKVLLEAEEANPRDPRVPFWVGVSQLQLQKRKEAKASFTRFLAIAPSRFDKQIAMAKQRIAELP